MVTDLSILDDIQKYVCNNYKYRGFDVIDIDMMRLDQIDLHQMTQYFSQTGTIVKIHKTLYEVKSRRSGGCNINNYDNFCKDCPLNTRCCKQDGSYRSFEEIEDINDIEPNLQQKQKFQFNYDNIGEKCIVRNSDDDKWKLDFFSHVDEVSAPYQFVCVGGKYKQCVSAEGISLLTGTKTTLLQYVGTSKVLLPNNKYRDYLIIWEDESSL